MQSHVLVERALSLVPDLEEFLPLSDALIGISEVDREKRWAGSGAYQALGKRVVDPRRLDEMLSTVALRAQERLTELFRHVVAAIRAQQESRPEDAVFHLVEAGELEEAGRRLEKAERLYSLAHDLARDLRDKRPQILTLRRFARVARAQGRLEQAYHLYEQSYQLSADEVDLPGRVIACQGLGNVCGDRGQRERAREWYELGLRVARGLDNPELEWPLHANLSMLARQLGELELAREHLERARAAIDRTGSQSALLFWFNNQGLLLSAQGDDAGAELVYREALAQPLQPFSELTLRVNLGHALASQGRLLEAEEEARRAEEVGIIGRLVSDLVDVYDLLGTIARYRRDEGGFVFYEQGLAIARERELPTKTEAALYHGYGRLQLACGAVDEGVTYLERSRRLFQSLGLEPELMRVVADLQEAQAAAE
jgi:tetratricopeptide (TPR) repeat protein